MNDMRHYEDGETRDADLLSLTGDHRFGALLDLLADHWEAESVMVGDPNIASDHGRLAYYVGRMDCYRLIRDELKTFSKHDDA